MSVSSFGRPAAESQPDPAPPRTPTLSLPPVLLPIALDEESLQAAYEAVRSTVRQAALDGLADAAKAGS